MLPDRRLLPVQNTTLELCQIRRFDHYPVSWQWVGMLHKASADCVGPAGRAEFGPKRTTRGRLRSIELPSRCSSMLPLENGLIPLPS